MQPHEGNCRLDRSGGGPLSRGRNPKVLAGLRKRISHLFLTFCETPEFNPEVVRFQIDPAQFEGLIDNFDSSIRV